MLPERCLIGRSRACDLVLTASDVSGQHALLRWTGASWELQDLGSRNGTHVDDARVAVGARAIVPLAARLRFGHEETWTLLDASPPQLMAVRADTDEVRLGEDGILSLPDTHEPVLCIFQDAGGAWVCERGGESSALADHAIVSVGDVAWKVHLPGACRSTAQDAGGLVYVAGLRLRLIVSRDEEDIHALAFSGERVLDLQVRAHNYLLLLFARKRLADRDAGVPDAEQGWIHQHDLLRMLRIDENHLNIMVHRARTHLGRSGVSDAATLIERRTGPRQLRLGVRTIELVSQEDAARPR